MLEWLAFSTMALVVALLYVLAPPAQWFVWQIVEMWWEKYAPKTPAQMTTHLQGKPVESSETPKEILAYAASWADDWARSEAMERAKRLYAEHRNWDIVYQHLMVQDGEKVRNG
jgi:hypothetical protein